MASSSNKPPPSTAAPSSTARNANPYYPNQTPGNAVAGPSSMGSQSYYETTGSAAWQNAWTMAAYPYSSQTITPYPQQQYTYTHFQPQITPTNAPRKAEDKPAVKQKSPSPSPPPQESCKYWDKAIMNFLERAGLVQALRGMELDVLVMNSEWERQKVPGALKDLVKDIQNLSRFDAEESINQPEILPLEFRKLDYVHLADGAEPRTPTSINKSIATFLAEKRANNGASNRAEFLRFPVSQDGDGSTEESSCARTDAREINRDAQIKYDIAKNEDGPLRRTMKAHDRPSAPDTLPASGYSTKGKNNANLSISKKGTTKLESRETDDLPSDLHPGLDERLTNVESHLAVRYVPSPPLNLLERLRFVEEHIIMLEKDYPPWAALHFNQPNRGWPPPPKTIPIIVPPHLTRQSTKKSADQQFTTNPAGTGSSNASSVKGRKDSSLHRAVMERLEIQNAKSDLGANR